MLPLLPQSLRGSGIQLNWIPHFKFFQEATIKVPCRNWSSVWTLNWGRISKLMAEAGRVPSSCCTEGLSSVVAGSQKSPLVLALSKAAREGWEASLPSSRFSLHPLMPAYVLSATMSQRLGYHSVCQVWESVTHCRNYSWRGPSGMVVECQEMGQVLICRCISMV